MLFPSQYCTNRPATALSACCTDRLLWQVPSHDESTAQQLAQAATATPSGFRGSLPELIHASVSRVPLAGMSPRSISDTQAQIDRGGGAPNVLKIHRFDTSQRCMTSRHARLVLPTAVKLHLRFATNATMSVTPPCLSLVLRVSGALTLSARRSQASAVMRDPHCSLPSLLDPEPWAHTRRQRHSPRQLNTPGTHTTTPTHGLPTCTGCQHARAAHSVDRVWVEGVVEGSACVEDSHSSVHPPPPGHRTGDEPSGPRNHEVGFRGLGCRVWGGWVWDPGADPDTDRHRVL